VACHCLSTNQIAASLTVHAQQQLRGCSEQLLLAAPEQWMAASGQVSLRVVLCRSSCVHSIEHGSQSVALSHHLRNLLRSTGEAPVRMQSGLLLVASTLRADTWHKVSARKFFPCCCHRQCQLVGSVLELAPTHQVHEMGS